MIRMRQVQDGVVQKHHQLFVRSFECSCERVVVSFCHNAISDPLPKLSLGGPKLLAIAANNQGRFLLYLLFLGLVCAHLPDLGRQVVRPMYAFRIGRKLPMQRI